MTKKYFILAYYRFCEIADPQNEVASHKAFLEKLDARGRIYISEQGINGQMSIFEKDAQEYIDWMHAREEFRKMPIKVHEYHEHAFEKLKIKYREQIVALDCDVDMTKTGEHLSPEKWW